MKKVALISLSLLSAHTSFAMFCPTNFNEINIGDDIAYVQKQCGKPTSETQQIETSSPPQEWVYFIKQNPNTQMTNRLAGMNPTTQMTTRLTIGFVKDKVVNLTVSGLSVTTASYCAGGNVNVGDSMKSVQTVCGKPEFISKAEDQNGNSGANPATPKITVLTYTNAATTATLRFENGRLKSK